MPEIIALLDSIDERIVERMRSLLPPGFSLIHAKALDPKTQDGERKRLDALVAHADYAISGQIAVDARTLKAGKRLKLLHKWGVGVDNLDLEAARALGIRVARTTGSNALPVAEFALGLILATLRNIPQGHRALNEGRWEQSSAGGTPFLLSGKTVGMIGFGAIARRLAGLLKGFGCESLYYKPRPLSPEEERLHGTRFAPMAELLERSDIVSLHCPLNDRTRHLVDRAFLAAMKKNAVLVNVARGEVVVEEALIEALAQGRLRGAAMDVFESEPLPADSPLLEVERLIITPHIAAMAADNFEPTVRRMFGNILALSQGKAIPEDDAVI
ncbi:MAG: 3-phosphoglycerate dehydrogenase [Ectothiorhodospiraceae bacterium AqS1]|nr:3-phosphoglycerate dehydrogenase [Ectothiorhodospiraceae bacterium AqS1]